MVSSSNVPLVTALNRDQRMYGPYEKYLYAWYAQLGDTLNLFNSTGPVSQYGAWGLREYAGRPIAETPKRRPVMEFVGTAP